MQHKYETLPESWPLLLVSITTFFSCASFDHLLYFPEEGLHLLQVDQILSKNSYILSALYARNQNIDRRNVVSGDKKVFGHLQK